MGRQYEPGDVCDDAVARALGPDEVDIIAESAPVSEAGGTAPIRKTKPLKRASLK